MKHAYLVKDNTMDKTETAFSPFDDVKLFMDVCGDSVEFEKLVDMEDTNPKTNPKLGQAVRYYNLVHEELGELASAKTREEVFDAILDSIFVLIGLGVSLGLPMDAGWEEVCKSNMTKIDPKTGKVTRNPDTGKIMKGDKFSPPNLKKVIDEHYNQKTHIQAV